jgi:uncharacterized cupin superfamily protein
VVVHWDEIQWESVDRGELCWERQRLVSGLSRYRVPAGRRLMPVHVHVDEEEFVVALEGGGLSWQDGTTVALHAGEVVLHRPDEEAHTLIAGDDGLEVLIFASGSPTGLTLLPRAQVLRVGNGLWPLEVRDPFAAEPPLSDVPEPTARAAAIADMAVQDEIHGRSVLARRDPGDELGSTISGLGLLTHAPDAEGYPPHCHSVEKETFVVLGGSGTLLLGEERHPVRRGHVIERPPGSRVAHSFTAGPEGLEVLAWGTRDHADAVYYPRSGNVGLRGLGVRFRPEQVGYWDGEP